jgi:hypothetical protein
MMASAELLTGQLSEVQKLSTIASSSTSDTNDPGAFTDFASRSEDRISAQSVAMLESADLVQFPQGQGFALINGGELFKLRVPSPSAK